MSEQNDEIWASMKGAASLREIYGYWPTLHDAFVQAIDIDFGLRQIIFTFDYSDLVDEQAMCSTGTRISMRWGGVQEAKLSEYSEDLYGVDFFRRGTLIETRFAEYEFGLDGYILAETIEVLQVEQPQDDFFKRKKIKLSFK